MGLVACKAGTDTSTHLLEGASFKKLKTILHIYIYMYTYTHLVDRVKLQPLYIYIYIW